MNEPSRELFERRIPKVKVTIDDDETAPSGTSICIWDIIIIEEINLHMIN